MSEGNASGGLPVRAAIRREETVVRHGGIGDNWHMSWAADDRQVVSMCDGLGWEEQRTRFHNSRLLSIHGDAERARFEDLGSYPDLDFDLADPATWMRYYAFGTLALDGRIYQFLSTPNRSFDLADPRFVGVKLIHSPDDGRTWCNQDGSTPVVWEDWAERSRENMLFFEESQDAFSLPSVLQMGRGYAANEDGYVYVYAPNGNTDGTMNELVMCRVAKDRLLDRGAYEFFAARTSAGGATWTPDINSRAVVHTFPRGWVNTKVHPYAWQPSVVYNEPLGLYMMTTWGMGCTPDGTWFGKPSYLGLWVARQPWGPWTQIHEETAWQPASDAAARAYQPQIAPKWIAADGMSFWLVWTDFQSPRGEGSEVNEFREARESGRPVPADVWEGVADLRPYYGFNVQRVDLLA